MDVLKDGGKPGTTPDEMLSWLRSHGFDADDEYEDANDGAAFQKLRENVMNGIPAIVEWADLGGVRWTPLSRQKRVAFKRVTDQPAAEWRCPNFNSP